MIPLAAVVAAWAGDSARIDDHTALIRSHAAPLADRGSDASAVWVSVPPDADGTAVVFFHGYDGFVTASAEYPEGFRPNWAPRGMPPKAVGVAYRMAELSDVGTLRPLVVLPEVGVADQVRAAFAISAAGKFADPAYVDPLGSLVTDVYLQLRGLQYDVPDPDRIIVAAHSGGGRVAAGLVASESLRTRAVDLLMLDATYGFGDVDDWVSLLRSWESFDETQDNRMVLTYIQGTSTQPQALAIRAAAEAAGVSVTRVKWGADDMEERLRTSGLVDLPIPRGLVDHGAFPKRALPVLVRTADH